MLARRHVTDVSAAFLADPFMVRSGGVWHMFFEVMNSETQKGEIGLATSDDGLAWAYQRIVLAEPFHLSYPYVFEWAGEFYMMPETLQANAVRLYKAVEFPTRWACLGPLVEGSFADPSIFRFADRWWIFACAPPYQHDTLRLYLSGELMGPWTEHPSSPIVEADKRRARPGGRVLATAFEISELTGDSYREEENLLSPILKASGSGWNGLGMHHVDAHPLSAGSWIACVDGFGDRDDPAGEA